MGLGRVSVAWASTAILFAACGLPVTVSRVDDETKPVEGVRYALRRPVYSMFLRVDLDKTEIFSGRVPTRALAKDDAALIPVSASWVPARQVKSNERVCIRTTSPLTLVLRQELKPKELYEVRSRSMWNLAHWFADSEVAVTVDDDQGLSAFTAGETDHFIEVVQNAFSIAATSAALAWVTPEGTKPPESCLLLGNTDFDEYVRAHARLDARRRDLKKAVETLEASTVSRPGSSKDQLESLALLRAELASINERLKVLGHALPEKRFKIVPNDCGNKKPAKPDDCKAPDAWVTLQLEQVKPW